MLYRRHGDTVFRYAWHLLGRREDAEDATQATFLAIHAALAGGTAVLESGAWVLRIARNECMGRLRQTARRPSVRSLDDGFDPPAAGGVERSAELRDEMRTARKTLAGLPEPEREAFVLREWLGLEAGEAALALGMTADHVDGLAARARRSLVLTIGGLEPPLGCSGTRSALEAGSLDRAAKVHLLRCPVCRGVRRALRPPEAAARPAVAQRLSAAIPGFASGGGGILAALTAKAATAPLLAKTAAIVVAAVAAGGAAEQAIVSTHPARHGRSHGGPARTAQASSPAPRALKGLAVVVARPDGTAATARSGSSATRGAAATPTGRRGSGDRGDDRGGHSSSLGASGDDNSGPGNSGSASGGGEGKGPGSDDGNFSPTGKGSSGDDAATSGRGSGSDDGATAGSGKGKAASATTGDAGDVSESGSGKGKPAVVVTTAPAVAESGSGDSGESGKGSGDANGSAQTSGGDNGSSGGDDGATTTGTPGGD